MQNRLMEALDASEDVQVVEGVLQRVNYQRRELTVIAHGRIWHFDACRDAQLYFEDQPVILRCFHPLDPVRVAYIPGADHHKLKALHAWERFATPV